MAPLQTRKHTSALNNTRISYSHCKYTGINKFWFVITHQKRAGFIEMSLTLRERHRVRVFQNKVLRRIFEPNRDDVTGEWRKLRKVDLHIFTHIIRQIK
jgi:hypothetical protein